MEIIIEKVIVVLIVILGSLLTIFDMPGNTLILFTSLGFAFFDENLFFNGKILSAMILIYLLGECWEFCVELFGIKKEKVSWFAVFLIGLGGFVGTVLGTAVFPVFGSIIGGMIGAFVVAFIYELAHTGISSKAFHLAWQAAKMRFLALIGKMAAGIALAALLVKQVMFI